MMAGLNQPWLVHLSPGKSPSVSASCEQKTGNLDLENFSK